MEYNEIIELIKSEGDYKQFTYGGYDCEIKRNPSLLHLCGYIKLDKTHPLHSVDYNVIENWYPGLPAHGGLTYSNFDEDGNWVIGYDCAHYEDWANMGGALNLFEFSGEGLGGAIGEYRTMEYNVKVLMDTVDFLNEEIK